jgi:hypothetical protein
LKAFVRYLAVNTPRPEAMADYYKKYFGLGEVVRSPEGDIALSDGWFKLCLLAHWPDDEIVGMSHYGIAVDDLGELQARLKRFGGPAEIGRDRGGDFHGEYFVSTRTACRGRSRRASSVCAAACRSPSACRASVMPRSLSARPIARWNG